MNVEVEVLRTLEGPDADHTLSTAEAQTAFEKAVARWPAAPPKRKESVE